MLGVQKFLQFIYDNLTTILVCIGLVIGIIKRIKDYHSKSTEEKVAIAKAQIHEAMLKLIGTAEIDWAEWSKAGSIKRSQVIREIYKEYPILSTVVDQTELIQWIDAQIDEALDTLRGIIKENEKDTSK